MSRAPAPPDLAGLPGDDVAELERAGLAVLAAARFPAFAGDVRPDIVRFVVSSFSPLVAELAERCLTQYFGTRPVDPGLGERTGVVLASTSGDFATARAVAEAIDAGRRVPPMLFYQSNPNAVVGYLTARWGLYGPVLCTSPATDALGDALRAAQLIIDDGDASAMLVIVAEPGRDPVPGQAQPAAEHDHGVAILIGPGSWPPARSPDPAGGAA